MKKLFTLTVLLIFSTYSFSCYSQNALEAAKFSILNKKKMEEKYCFTKKIKCLKKNARLAGSSTVGSKSKAIDHINWYKLKGLYYAVVYFKRNLNPNVEYIYGGWKLSLEEFNVIKSSFENSNSKGQFFWKFINPSKIACDYYDSRYDFLYGNNGECF